MPGVASSPALAVAFIGITADRLIGAASHRLKDRLGMS